MSRSVEAIFDTRYLDHLQGMHGPWLPIAAIQANTIVDSVGIISAMGDEWRRVHSFREKERIFFDPDRPGPTKDCDTMARVWETFLDYASRGCKIKEEEKLSGKMRFFYPRLHEGNIAIGSWSFVRDILRLEDEQIEEIVTGARRAFQALLDGKEADPEDVQKAKGLIASALNAGLCRDIFKEYGVLPLKR